MAVPKRRTSRSRKLKRRAQWKLERPSMSTCAECGSPRIPHRVCPGCGHYAGRQVVSTTTE
ncbi:MAG: 50S ribosomal protein L32 [Candidatus Latescibacterota bacterium]|nr:MAG: 50S ribosomal protein L32 [Candidatus Latescibacterota bacterium]